MEYQKIDNKIFVRLDRGDEIISSILGICKAEGVHSATFTGIGGCSEVLKLTYRPASDAYEEHFVKEVLDIALIHGNITTDISGALCHHTHSVMTYTKDNNQTEILAGHTLRVVVSYAAEITITPLSQTIIRTVDPENGAQIWHFDLSLS